MRFAPQRRAIFPDRNFQNVSDHEVFCTFFTYKCASRHSAVPFSQIATCKMCLGPSVLLTFSLANVLRATAQCHFCRSQLAKCAWTVSFFNIFTYKCALRHSAVPFLQMATSKMLPTKRCFVHFDLEMCFSLQRRTEAGHSVAR